MSVTSGLVLYVVIWFVTFLVAIPIRLTTQGDAGEIVPGTMPGSPHSHGLRKKAIITTVVAAVIWASLVYIIINELITVQDFDWFGRMDGMEFRN